MDPNNSTDIARKNMYVTDDALPPKKGFWKSLRELIQFCVIVLVIVLPIRFFIVEPFIVNGASMDPTFSTGQFLMVDRLSYRFENPQRGDVLVFKYPNNPHVYYIKRIIGLPGETISIVGDRVTITSPQNAEGFTLSEPYVAASHRSTNNSQVSLGDTQYFVMGDNRAQSSDSRMWGPLDRSLIVGRPIIRLFPVNKLTLFPGQYEQKLSTTQ